MRVGVRLVVRDGVRVRVTSCYVAPGLQSEASVVCGFNPKTRFSLLTLLILSNFLTNSY